MTDRTARLGFVIAGLVNIVGILLISRFLTSDTLYRADPNVWSDFGVVMVILWGIAYIGAARYASTTVVLPAAFAFEKLAYASNWVMWLSENSDSLGGIIQQDFLGGFFLSAYGIVDGLFCIFFTLVALHNWRRRPA